MIEIIKTEDENIVIERKITDTEINIQELKDRIIFLQEKLNEIIDVEIADFYPEEVKEIIFENNHLKEIERVGLLAEIEIMQERLNNLIWE